MKILTKLLWSSLVTTGLTAGVIGTTTLLMNQRQDRMNATHQTVAQAIQGTHQIQTALNHTLFTSYDGMVLRQAIAPEQYQTTKTQFLQALSALQRTLPRDPEVVEIERTYQALDRLLQPGSLGESATEMQQRYAAVQGLRDKMIAATQRLSARTAQQFQDSYQQVVDFEEQSQVIAQIVGLVVSLLFLGQFLLILVPIIRSIQMLQAGATAIGTGQLEHRLNLQTGDELEQLGQNFNQMATQLAELYQNLEARVVERTAALNQVNQDLATEIAERSVIELALRQTEANNRALLEALPDLLIRMSADGTYLDFVQAGAGAMVKLGESLVGRNVTDVLPADLASQRLDLIRQTLATGNPQVYEYQLACDGDVRHEEARIVVSSMNQDEVLVIVRDISDRKRAERHLHLQHLTTRVLADATTPEAAIEQLLPAICANLGWTLAEFWSVDGGLRSLQCTASWLQPGDTPAAAALREFQAETCQCRLAQGAGLPGQIWQQQAPLWLSDMSQASEIYLPDRALPSELRSALGFPVMGESQVLGVMVLLSQQPRHPDPGLLDLMTTIGSQIGQLIERHQAAAEVQRQMQRAQLLATITLRIRQSLNLEKILKTTVAEVRQFLQTDRVVIYRFLPDCSGDVSIESVGEDWMPITGLNVQDTCFQTSHVPLYKKGRIRVISDIYKADLNACHVHLLEQLQVRANLVVPIFVSGKLWGLLIVHHCQGPRQWQSDEVQLLEQLSVQVAIALQQAELHTQLRDELQERRQAEIALRESESRLREQTTQLQQALAELKHLQTQLIQTEKMSSLGQLVGGIAHEINNPVSFVHVNLNYVQEYADSLMALLHLYQEEHPQPSPVLQRALADTDLDFLSQDLPKILQSMQTGTERIRDIVRSLRNFSRLDEAEFKTVDLHEGLDSTLMLLSQRLAARAHRPAIVVNRRYAEPVPPVHCYAGQLNQVFMNILHNAIDALESSYDPGCSPLPTITLETGLTESGWVTIRITDNGPGIAPEVKSRIFDPFFTTKPVGAGTGMGLAVSYQIIVERHQGQLTCHSHPGAGTTFTIEIPLQQVEAQPVRSTSSLLAASV